MSFDETIRDYGDRKVYRRKRRFQGASWTPPSASAVHEDGEWCRNCMKRHGYMSMGTSYNKTSAGWELNWLCPKTDDVLATLKLGNNNG